MFSNPPRRRDFVRRCISTSGPLEGCLVTRRSTTMLVKMLVILQMARYSIAGRSRSPAFVSTTQILQRTSQLLSRTGFPANNNKEPLTHRPLLTRVFSSFIRDQEGLLEESGYTRPVVQWYPGHIAKAERQLAETLKAVDVVVEVRDARACKATAHPRVGEWCAGRPRVVVLTHLDMIPKQAVAAWRRAYETLGAERWDDAPINNQVANQAQQARDIRFQYGDNQPKSSSSKKKDPQIEKQKGAITPVDQVLFVNAKEGQGIHALHRAIYKAGAHVQERRERRGLNPRPLRVGIIGYPNVGKSALINRILGRKRAKTANTPGVTRSLQWIRIKTDDTKTSLAKEFELLDSPGIIPAKMVDQSDALLLAACNCIGEAAYDNQAVAAYLCEWLKTINLMKKQSTSCPQWRDKCKERYGFDPLQKLEATGDYMTGEDMLFLVADNTCRGDPEDASRKILQDFRAGRMGPISLQLAPESEGDDGQLAVEFGEKLVRQQRNEGLLLMRQQDQEQRALKAVEVAKERGLELPPIVEKGLIQKEDDIGKGMFDGW